MLKTIEIGEEKIKKSPTKVSGFKKIKTHSNSNAKKVIKKQDSHKSVDKNQKKKPIIDYSKPALVVEGFTKRYKGSKIPAVEKVSFKVMPGEFHGFIGANGAGKTTTIKSLIGAYAKFEGDVKMFGHKSSSKEAKEAIGYIPEAAKFPKGMSTVAYISYMSYLSGMNMKDAKKYAIDKLKELGLEKVMKRSPNTFSSGQKKKVLLAQALVHDPSIIIMDEPAANLDPKARFEFFEELQYLQSQGKAIFISSHILAELDKFVDSVTIVDGGQIVYTGSIAEAISNHQMQYLLKTSDEVDMPKIAKIVNDMKLISFNDEGDYVVEFVNRKNIYSFMKRIAEDEILLEIFRSKKENLEEIYRKYVQKGSRETGTGKVGA